MRTEVEIRAELRAFVQRRAKGRPVTDQTPLFTQRLLRSVHVPELILLLERLRGAPIDVEQLRQGDFDTIDVMVDRFGEACEPNIKHSGDACEPNIKHFGDACEPNINHSGDACEPNIKPSGVSE